MQVTSETAWATHHSSADDTCLLGEFVLLTLKRIQDLLARAAERDPTRASLKSVTFAVPYDPGPGRKALAMPMVMDVAEATRYFRANDLRVTLGFRQLLRAPATRIARLEVTIRV